MGTPVRLLRLNRQSTTAQFWPAANYTQHHTLTENTAKNTSESHLPLPRESVGKLLIWEDETQSWCATRSMWADWKSSGWTHFHRKIPIWRKAKGFPPRPLAAAFLPAHQTQSTQGFLTAQVQGLPGLGRAGVCAVAVPADWLCRLCSCLPACITCHGENHGHLLGKFWKIQILFFSEVKFLFMLPLCRDRHTQHLFQKQNSGLLFNISCTFINLSYMFVPYDFACTLWHSRIYLNYQQLSSMLSCKVCKWVA